MEGIKLHEIDFISFEGYVLTEEFDYEEKKHTDETFSLYNQGFDLDIFKTLGDLDYYEGVAVSCGVPYFQFYIDGGIEYVEIEVKVA